MAGAGIKKKFQGTFFELQYPVFWLHEIIEDIPAFYDPNGSGALQVASVIKDSEIRIEEEMQQFLFRHSIEYERDKIALVEDVDFASAACEFISQDRFWLVHMLSLRRRLLIVMYNSDEIPTRETGELISEFIRSIRFLDTQT